MNQINNPALADWPALCRRPYQDPAAIVPAVQAILDTVRSQGDAALLDYTARFDGVRLNTLRLAADALASAEADLPPALIAAIAQAQANIAAFHAAQRDPGTHVETMPGVRCWRRQVPIERVGLYVPGGTAPLVSTLLMLAVPAQLAGCQDVVICTPPDRTTGQVHPAIRYVAHRLGLTQVFAVGGAQAVAAMAFGTESIPQVDKIFGPGNQYVTVAKQLVSQQGMAIDMPAGPSEVLVLALPGANPEFVAWDLLAQAEHGPDSQVVLVTNDEALVPAVQAQLDRILPTLPRADVARKALANSHALFFPDAATCLAFSNAYAPEHLILAGTGVEALLDGITHAGSVFVGNWTPESAGDYASGTNHTLPTGGFARAWSGVSLDSFCKKITFQELSPTGARTLAPTVEALAAAEGLAAHAGAMTARREAASNGPDPSPRA